MIEKSISRVRSYSTFPLLFFSHKKQKSCKRWSKPSSFPALCFISGYRLQFIRLKQHNNGSLITVLSCSETHAMSSTTSTTPSRAFLIRPAILIKVTNCHSPQWSYSHEYHYLCRRWLFIHKTCRLPVIIHIDDAVCMRRLRECTYMKDDANSS